MGLYANAVLLSATAASMIVLVRRLRGHTSLVDVALPLSILNIGQAETLLIGFAMNLMLTSWISCELIRLASAQDSRLGWPLTLQARTLVGALAAVRGMWSDHAPASSLVAGLRLDLGPYARRRFRQSQGRTIDRHGAARRLPGRCRLVHDGLQEATPSSAAHLIRGSLIHAAGIPQPGGLAQRDVPTYWRFAGLIVVFLVAATLARLGWVGWRQPDERRRAFAMVAVILAMLCAAVAVGVLAFVLGPGEGRASRYVTTTAPLFCALYVAWLVHGSARARRFVHAGAVRCDGHLAVPANIQVWPRRTEMRGVTVYTRLERGMKAHSPISAVVNKAWPYLLPQSRRSLK